jgi:hypothetical protein
MASTYTPIATQTLASAAASYTFSSIPSTYTDLVLIVNGTCTLAANAAIRYNGDTGSNYSLTYLLGDGSSAQSGRNSDQTSLTAGQIGTDNSTQITSIMNYANTTTYKTMLSRGNWTNNLTRADTGLWRSTAAINSVTIFSLQGYNFNAGSTFTLYGIASA